MYFIYGEIKSFEAFSGIAPVTGMMIAFCIFDNPIGPYSEYENIFFT